MRAHLSNAAYGVLDYAAYPVAMLVSAPTLLRHLGIAQYGIWIVITAAVNTGGVIASGFGDANIQYIASARSHGDRELLLRAVRSMLGINLLLGGTLAAVSWVLVPLAAGHLVSPASGLQAGCLLGLQIASVLMLVRAIESVCVSTQRAFERYGAAIRISLFARVITVVAAVVLSMRGFGVAGIMEATACFMILGTVAQLMRLQQYLGAASLLPSFDRHTTRALFQFGPFSWLLAASSVIFTQADRLLLGVSLGATTVTAYALCVQMAQPIYGIASSGLHFLFPYLSARNAVSKPATIQKAVLTAFSVNFMIVAAGTLLLLLFGHAVLNAWVGPAVALSASAILAPIAWSFAFLGLSVTGYYSLLALGRVHTVTALNLTGGLAMLLLMACLLPLQGVHGIATARLSYGLIALLMYVPLARALGGARATSLSAADICPVCEDV
ncbi:MAG TPA: oligosaccharide flippase family protein [Acidobacteriaceae bacterium]|jgi:O-antigen/teichoic acid export membrane protein|nr:oligosaccharide flippase family protein [Acidobacteriaceae bacterium]